MDDPYEFVPPFVSPLTHDQHARLGRIAILWGQVDMMLDILLQEALGITGEQRQALLGERPIGGKLDLLKNNLKGLANEAARNHAEDFWDLTNQTKTMRNKCFHGVWGFNVGKREGDVGVAAKHYKDAENPVKVTQLPALEKKLCKTARAGWSAVVAINGWQRQGCARMFHGRGFGDEGPPWLPEWSAQHRLDVDALDRRHKRGQLPYLKKPL